MTCIKPATGTNTVLYYVKEVDCGVTPDNPQWKPLRFTGGIPVLNRESLVSAEMDGTREINGFRLGKFNPSGDTNVEISYGSHDDILEGAQQSTWTTGAIHSGVSVTVDPAAKTFTRSTGSYTSNFAVGDLVKFVDLTGKNQGPFLITALTATVMTCAGAKDLTAESATTDVKQGDKLLVGKEIISFSILVHYTDLENGAGGYDIIRGCEVSTSATTIAVNSLVTGTFGFIGKSYEVDAALPAGSTFANPMTTRPFASFDGRIQQDGQTLGFVTSAGQNTDNAAEANFEIGSRGPSFISYGRVNNTLTLETYFYDYSQFKKFAEEQKTSLGVILSLDGKAMAWRWPEFYYTEGAPDVSGEGSISQNLTGQAVRETGPSSLIIQRVQ